MILVLSAQQPQLTGPKDDRFGRAAWLIKMDTETNEWEALANPGASQSGGAGVAAAQFVVDQKAGAVISGAFGPNAAGAFRQAGIEMRLYNNDVSTVEQAVEQFRQGKLTVFE